LRARLFATTPLLIVSDLERSIRFYCDQLGFVEPAVWGDFAMMHRDEFDLMLRQAESAAEIRPNGPLGDWDVHLRVDDVAAEQTALAAAGVPVARGPTRTEYDMIEIEVLDPDGHRLCFGQDVTRRPEDAHR
jgi:catechol 2,3-dioxygenase-like lactoylglutathione lyase family enzyme